MARKILLTGATGYIGGRLQSLLEGSANELRCVSRRPEALAWRSAPQTEIVHGDVLNHTSMVAALEGIDTAFYLVHSMGSASDFEDSDREGARNFASAASQCGVRRIIYVGGLGEADETLSPHLRSRQEVGEILRRSGVPTIEFRASIVIGSGSLSFELVRSLVERLPAMVTPRWVSIKAQPIAIDDLLQYLVAAIDLPDDGSRVFEIGGADPVSYGDLMREYARQRGLHRPMIPVPVLTPRLSSWWLGLVTPVYARVGRKLIDGIRNPTVVRDTSALDVFDIQPVGMAEAIAAALRHEDREFAQTRWSDSLSSGSVMKTKTGRFGRRLLDARSIHVDLPPSRLFEPVRRIGGDTGWYAANRLWRLRAFMDLLIGGVGLRRGRPHPVDLHVGDPLDFWRVEAYEPGHLLRLFAEMKVPGRAWLQFEVKSDGEGGATLYQTAVFDPAGVLGPAYWYLLYPIHLYVFSRMLRQIVAAAHRMPGPASGTA